MEVKQLAIKDVEVRNYFLKNTPESYRAPMMMNAAIGQLIRAGIYTMDTLDAMTDEKIERIRNIGKQRRELVLLMRDKYRIEHLRY